MPEEVPTAHGRLTAKSHELTAGTPKPLAKDTIDDDSAKITTSTFIFSIVRELFL